MHSAPAAQEPYDADLREYRREQAISALAARYTPNKLTPLTTRVARKRNSRPLFEPEDDELPQLPDAANDDEDPELASAIQESLELEEEASLRRAMEESRRHAPPSSSIPKNGEKRGSNTEQSGGLVGDCRRVARMYGRLERACRNRFLRSEVFL